MFTGLELVQGRNGDVSRLFVISLETGKNGEVSRLFELSSVEGLFGDIFVDFDSVGALSVSHMYRRS